MRVFKDTQSLGKWPSSWRIHSFPIVHWSPRKIWKFWILPRSAGQHAMSAVAAKCKQNSLVGVMFWVTSCILHLILKSLFANVQILSQFRFCRSFRKPSSFIFQFFSDSSDMIGFEPATSTNVSDTQIVSCSSIFGRLNHSVWKCSKNVSLF